MTVYSSCLLSLLCLLLLTHWIDTANLRAILRSSSKWSSDRRSSSLISDNESTTLEPILSRRRPLLPASDRQRRWSYDEIPIDETFIEQLTSTMTLDNQTTVFIDKSEDIFLFNSTSSTEQFHITPSHKNSDENFTSTDRRRPLLRQDVADTNQTDDLSTVAINEEISQNNGTDVENNNSTIINTLISTVMSNDSIDVNTIESKIVSTIMGDIDQERSKERNQTTADVSADQTTIESISNDTETSSMPVVLNQTTKELANTSPTELSTNAVSTIAESEQDTAIILLDHTTIISATIESNQTSIDSEGTTMSESNTTISDEPINATTTIIDTIVNETTFSERNITDSTTITDVTQNDTATVISDMIEYSNETVNVLPAVVVEPICDLSCQCSKECPYGFEFLNDTCECYPPCKNYQCFGNDTCTVTNEGRPLCQPNNGTEHDRPRRCYQPQDPGYHDATLGYHNRWYYNPDQDTCHLLVYRGLGGNENNFPTLHECNVECITCAPGPDPGECQGRLPMWYYDYKKNQCSPFDYSGCKGNENKFSRKQDCLDTCLTRILNL